MKRKKVLSILLVSAMVAGMAAGCGNNGEEESSGKGGKTLEVWLAPLDDDTEKNWGDLLGDWEKENDCTVDITVIP